MQSSWEQKKTVWISTSFKSELLDLNTFFGWELDERSWETCPALQWKRVYQVAFIFIFFLPHRREGLHLLLKQTISFRNGFNVYCLLFGALTLVIVNIWGLPGLIMLQFMWPQCSWEFSLWKVILVWFSLLTVLRLLHNQSRIGRWRWHLSLSNVSPSFLTHIRCYFPLQFFQGPTIICAISVLWIS